LKRECLACGERDCPHGEPLHYHHDGCPACEWLADATAAECPACNPLDREPLSVREARRKIAEWEARAPKPLAEPVVVVPPSWLVMGQTLELIPAGAVVEVNPASGHARCHRGTGTGVTQPAHKSPAEDQPSPKISPDPPPWGV